MPEGLIRGMENMNEAIVEEAIEAASTVENRLGVSRREFLSGAFSTGAFVLACQVIPRSAWAQAAAWLLPDGLMRQCVRRPPTCPSRSGPA